MEVLNRFSGNSLLHKTENRQYRIGNGAGRRRFVIFL